MVTLPELMTAVREQNLSKDMLEHYHSELCTLKAQLKQELAGLKKEKAFYIMGREQGESMASREASFNATKSGLRKFEVEGYIGSTNALLEGVKARLYAQY